MIKASGRTNVIILQEEVRRTTNLVEGMRLLARKSKVIILQLLALLLVRKTRTAHCNISYSHLWRKGCYRRTRFNCGTKKEKRDYRFKSPAVIEYNFTSRFPVSFRGYFMCGATDHFSKIGCLVGMNGNEEKRAFLKELWSHKPHTKRKIKDGSSVSAF